MSIYEDDSEDYDDPEGYHVRVQRRGSAAYDTKRGEASSVHRSSGGRRSEVSAFSEADQQMTHEILRNQAIIQLQLERLGNQALTTESGQQAVRNVLTEIADTNRKVGSVATSLSARSERSASVRTMSDPPPKDCCTIL